MKAVLFRKHGGAEVLEIADAAAPEAGPGEVVVRVDACGVNRLDVMVREGTVPVKVLLPHVSGSEVAGVVAAVGPEASGVAAGDRVAVAPYLFCGHCEYCLRGEETRCLRGDILGLVSQGGYAELVKVPARSVVPLPPEVEPVAAAAVGLAALTAYHMLFTRARVRAGEDVLVVAAGSGVGSAAVQLARLAGARVIATVGSEAKREQALALGAHEVVLHEGEFRREVRALTQKRGVDLVVEHVGAATWPEAVACLARGGRVVTCGAFTGSQVPLDLWGLFARENTILGGYGGTRAELAELLKLVARKQFRPVLHQTYPLEEAAAAQRAMERRQHFGKLVLVV